MSSAQQPQPQAVRVRDKPQRQGMVKLIAWGVVGVLILIFIVSNTQKWKVSFWFLHSKGEGWYAWVVLIITLVIGFAVGFVLSALLRRRKKKELRRRAQSA